MDEHAGMMGEWKPPSPSSKAFFPSYLGGGEQVQMSSGSKSEIPEARNRSGSFGSYQGTGVDDSDVKKEGISFENDPMLSHLPDVKRKGGLGDRLAARAGFNAPRLNTEIIRSNDRSSTDEVKSPYLTIPPGISPTALLESPVFLSNSLTQASPTTGKFPFFPDFNMRGTSTVPNGPSKEDFFDDVNGSTFAFKPHPEQFLPFSRSTGNKMGRAMNPQSFLNFDVTVSSQNTFQNFMQSQIHLCEEFSQSSNGKDIAREEMRISETISAVAEHSASLSDQQDNVDDDDDGDQRVVDNTVVGSVEEDVYNWRKYGQKQVKGSEFPRSYFKCTHMTCPVKKKVERSREGHITEIIYTGEHNHPKPALSRRPSTGFNQFDDANSHENGGDMPSVWGAAPGGIPREWRNDSLISMNSELLTSSPPLHMQNGVVVRAGDPVNPSSTFSNDEEGDRETHVSASIANDGEGDEQESKRRRIETYAAEIGSGATRAIREPRVVVQTPSDVDIMDDGYRWRKYGQKVVKGNPNPRSYYKCTSVGCTVRKHVERASHDLKSVITTYEGKHNHDVPPARNSSHVNTSISAAFATQPQNLIQHPEPSQVTNMARYDRQPYINSFSMPMMQPFNPPLPMGMNQPSLANFSMAGLSHTQNKLSGMPVHAYIIHQQEQLRKMNEIGRVVPKGDPRVEPSSDPNLYLQNGSSVYQQIMNRLPFRTLNDT